MEPVEGVEKVLRASCLTDGHADLFRLPDLLPHGAAETCVDLIRIAVQRDHVPERTARGHGVRQRRPQLHPLDTRSLTGLLESRTELCLVLWRRQQGRAVIRERKRHPLRLATEVAHLDHRQASRIFPVASLVAIAKARKP